MRAPLYARLAPWYRLLDPTLEHAEEAGLFQIEIESILGPGEATLLELGAGAGNNAYFLKDRFRCTLTDISPEMLAASRTLNPACEHLVGDMRDLRLGRQFDAVLLHDAVVYMTTEAQLRDALETAFVHTRPGGAAIVAPDLFTETFVEGSHVYEGSEGARQLKCLEWVWDPDPTDSTYTVDYAFMLRDGVMMETAFDRHVEGLFSRSDWLDLLGKVGFHPETTVREVAEGFSDEVFVCRRP